MNCRPLLALSDRLKYADTHWRVVRPFARLRDQGIDAEVCWLDRDEMPTLPVAGRVVVLQRVAVKGGTREQTDGWVQRLRDAGAVAVVFEIDDDVISPAYLTNIDAAGGLELVSRARLEAERQALEWALQACDGVTVSTEPLAEVVRGFTDRPVIVVPNAIDVEWYRARLADRPAWAEYLTVGWAGGRRDEADLEPMAVAWGRISRRYPDVRFLVAGWQPDCVYREIEDLDRIIRDEEGGLLSWADLDGYPRWMQVDIGCCAVSDTPFNRCKSPIKSWEYSLAGASVIGTSALYGPTINDPLLGRFGLLANTADEWESALRWTIETPGERAWCQRRLAQHVEREHSLTANLHRWPAAYIEIAASVGAACAT